MKDLSKQVFEENGVFYFDAENYNVEEVNSAIDYEDGDCIKWLWEGKKMMGTLRGTPGSVDIFVLENVKVIG